MPQKLKNIYHLGRAILACVLYGLPAKNLKVIGVTGTDGKTTTVSLIYHILRIAGKKVARVTTVDSEIDGKKVAAFLHTTTPDPFNLQRFLRSCLKAGCEYVVLEVSSHGIDQNRIWGIPFEIGVLTNLAPREHTDYHGSFETYKRTKMKFIDSCQKRIIGLAGLTPKEISYSNAGTRFKLDGLWFRTKLLGEFNLRNCLSAVAVARALGFDDKVTSSAIAAFSPPAGRMEVVTTKPFTVIVDFAHTPQAFENVLPATRMLLRTRKSRLIHVFGATGDRDKRKRPLMGKIASQYDDIVILTHEDTYTEDPAGIISQLEEGLQGLDDYSNKRSAKIDRKFYLKVLDRLEAIKKALFLAKTGDVVLLTGVGHQQTMNIGGKEVPWSEQRIVQQILNVR